MECGKILPKTDVCPIRKRFCINDKFFADGNVACTPKIKQFVVDIDEEDYFNSRAVKEIQCSLAGCTTTFSSLSEFERHYSNLHRHVCKDCKRIYSSNYLLERHAFENHDSLFKVMAEKQNMYKCLVASCESFFKDPSIRNEHLINYHNFPANVRFAQVFNTMKHVNVKHGMDIEVNSEENLAEGDATFIETNTNLAESSTSTAPAPNKVTKIIFAPKIPKRICFGFGTVKGFPRRENQKSKKKHWHQLKSDEMDTSTNIEDISFDDLTQSLPE